MSTKKSVEDRFKAIQEYCKENHISLGLEFDPVDCSWVAWDDQEQLTDAADGLEELVEALESEFQLGD